MVRNYYEILGLSSGASQNEIKKRFKHLARKYHPEINPGDSHAENLYRSISEAYAVLSNPSSKKQYDRQEISPPHKATLSDIPTQKHSTEIGPKAIDTGFFSDMGLKDLISSILGDEIETRRDTDTGTSRGEDTSEDIDIDFKTAVMGGYSFITTRLRESCARCSGKGAIHSKLCSDCHGAGVVVRSERIRIKIPEGVNTDSRIRIRDKGMTGLKGGPRGDLYVNLRVRSHPYFDRKGDNIYANLPLTLSEAYCGADVTAVTIHGKVKIKVPARTQNGSLIRIRGKGVRNLKTNSYGDHYSRIQVMVPDRSSEVAKDYMKRLDEYYTLNIRAGLPDSL